jgi:hypothetical protein
LRQHVLILLGGQPLDLHARSYLGPRLAEEGSLQLGLVGVNYLDR